ncbi:MAG: PIG-L deacetylase family protein [Terriglobales bacterium]
MADPNPHYQSLRLMCITAHPDDEAGGFGGALRKYSDLGVKTCVVCLTPGQAATHRGEAKSDHELAAIRRREFEASCKMLKVSEGKVLDFPDGQLYRQDLYRVVSALTEHVRRFRPNVMLAFGPEGGLTGHQDHSMASVFASLAFHWAGRNNRYPDQLSDEVKIHRAQKLYYATADFAIPGRPPVTMPPATTVINIQQQLETKIAAFKTHSSQSPLWPFFEQNMRGRGDVEMYHLAAAFPYGAATQETDLFEGVKPA